MSSILCVVISLLYTSYRPTNRHIFHLNSDYRAGRKNNVQVTHSCLLLVARRIYCCFRVGHLMCVLSQVIIAQVHNGWGDCSSLVFSPISHVTLSVCGEYSAAVISASGYTRVNSLRYVCVLLAHIVLVL